jgi:hypothetical protein
MMARPEPPAPAVVAAIAPALREDLTPPVSAPLPPTRINGAPGTVQTASGPTLAWQQGPEAQSELSIARGMAFAPVPPRRPDADDAGSENVAGTVALAYAPLPPTRPSSLAATNPIPGIPELRGSLETAAVQHPLPPPRPDLRPIVVAAASPVDIPVTGSTPKGLVKAKPAAAPEAKSPPVAKKPPVTALSALMSAEPSLHMGFSSKPAGDLATNRFTGPAVKPLPVVR